MNGKCAISHFRRARKGNKEKEDEREIEFDNASRLLHFCFGYMSNVLLYSKKKLVFANLAKENI